MKYFKKMKRKEGPFLYQIKTQRHNAREHLVTSNLCSLLTLGTSN